MKESEGKAKEAVGMDGIEREGTGGRGGKKKGKEGGREDK